MFYQNHIKKISGVFRDNEKIKESETDSLSQK